MHYLDSDNFQVEQTSESKPQSKFLPSKSSPEATVPLHSCFEGVIRDEWDKPGKGSHVNKRDLRFYKIQEPKDPITELPKIDAAVASLARDNIIPSEGEFCPTDPTDRKMDITLKKKQTLRAPSEHP